MSAFKDGRLPITLDKERHLLFSLNVLDTLQDQCDGYDKLGDYLQGPLLFKRLKWLLTLLLNEGADESEEALTEAQVGRLIHTGNLAEVQSAIYKTFAIGTTGGETPPQPDAEEDEEEKNLRSGLSAQPALST